MSQATPPSSAKHDAIERLARQLYPNASVHLLKAQGGCSTTFLVEADKAPRILQFRHTRFSLDLNISRDVKQTYGAYAPRTWERSTINLEAEGVGVDDTVCYEMDVIDGVPYSSAMLESRSSSPSDMSRQRRLVEDFADFISLAWPAEPWCGRACNGRVGSRIPQKLQLLADGLPYANLRQVAKEALDGMDLLSRLPVVLNHGDVIPSNIMVDASACSLTGLVDWAEAEYLPFGTCLYGLEYLLGAYSSSARRDSIIDVQRFQYYACADELRLVFWARLKSRVPALEEDERTMQAVLLAKTIGTLLWYGFAWDDGAIDRVVNAADDGEVLGYLEAFLSREVQQGA
jgi:hypothetical protein